MRGDPARLVYRCAAAVRSPAAPRWGFSRGRGLAAADAGCPPPQRLEAAVAAALCPPTGVDVSVGQLWTPAPQHLLDQCLSRYGPGTTASASPERWLKMRIFNPPDLLRRNPQGAGGGRAAL